MPQARVVTGAPSSFNVTPVSDGAAQELKFGLFVPQGWRLDLVGLEPADHWSAMRSVAELADREGTPWESVWVYDHFHPVPSPTDDAVHEAWTLMAALAAATTRVRLGQMCTCMGYRNPAYLAKVAATVDVVSGGRVEMGIGAGWYEHEWRAYGYGFPRAGERLAQLAEGVEIFKQLWTTGESTFSGQQYTTDGALCRPLPLQDGGIPLWIAGGGEKKTLRIAAQHAQYTNFSGDLEGFQHKSAVLKGHCEDLGTSYDAITRSANYNVIIAETEAEVADRRAWVLDRLTQRVGAEVALAEVEKSYDASITVGTPEQVVENLRPLVEAGMTYPIVYFPEIASDTTSVELFEKTVIPALRG